MNSAYLKKLESRLRYFESKPITELERSEIDEYLAIMEEVEEITTPILESVIELIKETPEYKAELKYRERILKRR